MDSLQLLVFNLELKHLSALHLKVILTKLYTLSLYVLGSGSIGGNVIRFLRDNLGFIKTPSEVEALASSVEVSL